MVKTLIPKYWQGWDNPREKYYDRVLANHIIQIPKKYPKSREEAIKIYNQRRREKYPRTREEAFERALRNHRISYFGNDDADKRLEKALIYHRPYYIKKSYWTSRSKQDIQNKKLYGKIYPPKKK